MLYLLLGMLVAYVYVFTFALCKSAAEVDRQREEYFNNDEDGDL